MVRLGRVIVEGIVHHYGRDELLRRLAHPFWFQSFGAVMGMDWHSSGITTSVMGALKRGLAPLEHELGIHVCGGRGNHSRRTPGELVAVGERTGLDGDELARTSRLVAKVDSAAVQDGFGLYLHSFVVTDDGAWTVVQQGMDPGRRQARRYHWLSEGLLSFVDEPHAAIDGPNQGQIVNLTDRRAALSRSCQVELARNDPQRVLATLSKIGEVDEWVSTPHLQMPAHHDVRPSDVLLRRLRGTLGAAAEAAPEDFAGLLLIPGVGPRTVAALAMVSEVIHGAPYRFSDPARFSLAHGGKDGHPFPVSLSVYDETIQVLRVAVERAKLGGEDKLSAIRRLDDQARVLERGAAGPTLSQFIEHERARSSDQDGVTVFGTAGPRRVSGGVGPRGSSTARRGKPHQLPLF
jgi:hypothetical protein